jgi:hypothetical protein
MAEFRRVAKYKESGSVGLADMREIAEIVQFSSRFPSFDQLLEALSTNNLVLQSGPSTYRPGTSSL